MVSIFISVIQHEQYYLIILLIGLKVVTVLKESLAQMFSWDIFFRTHSATAFGLSLVNPRKGSLKELV